MRRSGIYGRCSFRDDRSQAACCGERFCAVVTTADGSTGNTPEALNRLNSACALTRASKRVTAAVLQEERMRLATIAALTVLVALPADAVQQRYQTASLAPTCDNGARCTTINAAVPIAPDVMSALESKGATAGSATAARQQGGRYRRLAQDRCARSRRCRPCRPFPGLYR
jgi:hypothetical protein